MKEEREEMKEGVVERKKAEKFIGSLELLHSSLDQGLAPDISRRFLHVLQKLKSYQIELEIQNRQLQDTQKELEESRNRYADLYDCAPVGYLTLDEKGVVHEVNQTLARMLGIQPSQLSGLPLLNCVAQEDAELFMHHLGLCKVAERAVRTELRLSNREGKPTWVQLISLPERGDTVKNPRSRTTVIDITDRKQSEMTTAMEHGLLEDLVEGVEDYIFIKDLKERYILTNRANARLFGRKPEEMLGKTVSEIFRSDEASNILKADRQVLESGETVTHEHEFKFQDQTRILFTTRAPWRDPDGKMIGIFGISRDITDRKQAELALEQQHGLLEALVEGVEEIIFIKDLEGRYILSNRAHARLFRKSPEEIVAKTVSEICSPDTASAILEADRQVLESGKAVDHKHEFHSPRGTRTVFTTRAPWRDKEGKVLGIFGISRDITEQQKEVEVLRLDRHLLNEIVEGSPDRMFVKDLEGRYVKINQSASHIFRMAPEEIIGKTDADLMAPEEAVIIAKEDRQILTTGQTQTFKRTISIGGGKQTLLVTKGVYRDPEGNVSGLLGIARDVTETTKHLQKIEKKLTNAVIKRDDMLAILHQLNIGIAMTDESGNLTFLNKIGERLFRKNHEEVKGKTWEQLFSGGQTKLAVLRRMMELRQTQRTKVLIQLEFPRGKSSWIEVDVRDKPWDPQRKIFLVHDVTEVHSLRTLMNERAQFGDLVGKSESMKLVFLRIQEVCQVDSTVLIEGETGTGKEVVAQAIHSSSRRKNNPFVAVNCGGLSDSLLEGQLFGHKRGAFTGAIADRKGVFEAAHRGTIFLDEIGDLSPSAQSRLLRVLQEREIVRLGESNPRKIDVRVLAATNKNLDQEVAEGRFRSDLLYRVKVGRIQLPALCERREDISLLVGLFLRQIQATTLKKLEEVSVTALRALMDYEWPGNVRELQNAIEFAAIRCETAVIELRDLPSEISRISAEDHTGSFGDSDSTAKKQLLEALKRADGNRTEAAKLLGISRITVHRRMAKYGLSIPK